MPSLKESIGMTNDQVTALIQLGHLLYREGRFEEAQTVFDGISILDESVAYSHIALGAIAARENKFDAAEEHLTRAITISSEDIFAWSNRGEVRLRMGKFADALSDFQEAIRRDPESRHPAANRARTLVILTREAVDLAAREGTQAVLDAKRRIDEQLAL